ncbi:ALP1-like protein, partial [Tanacetum coccineum]
CGKDDPDLKEEMEKQFVVSTLDRARNCRETVGMNTMRLITSHCEGKKRRPPKYQKEAKNATPLLKQCEQGKMSKPKLLMIQEKERDNHVM